MAGPVGAMYTEYTVLDNMKPSLIPMLLRVGLPALVICRWVGLPALVICKWVGLPALVIANGWGCLHL